MKKESEIKRRIRLTRILEGQIKVPFLKGRPDRETVISQDDIIDLRIVLNTYSSYQWDDFIYTC